MLANRFSLALPVLIAAAFFLRAQTDVTGFWLFKIPVGDGTFREYFLDLKLNGNQISGRRLQGKREAPITEGTFQDGKLHFVVTTRSATRTRQAQYHATLLP